MAGRRHQTTSVAATERRCLRRRAPRHGRCCGGRSQQFAHLLAVHYWPASRMNRRAPPCRREIRRPHRRHETTPLSGVWRWQRSAHQRCSTRLEIAAARRPHGTRCPRRGAPWGARAPSARARAAPTPRSRRHPTFGHLDVQNAPDAALRSDRSRPMSTVHREWLARIPPGCRAVAAGCRRSGVGRLVARTARVGAARASRCRPRAPAASRARSLRQSSDCRGHPEAR